jgi:integrase
MPSTVIPRGDKFAARVTLAGRQEWLGTFDTEQEALAAVEERKRKSAEHAFTVGEWAARWESLPGAKGARSKRTIQHNAKMIRPFVDAFGGFALAEIPDRVWLELVASTPGRARYVRTMLEDARRFRIIERNPLDGLVPSWQQPEVVPPTRDELDAMLMELERHGQYARLLASTAAWSGLRWAEVSRLTVGDVVLPTEAVNVTLLPGRPAPVNLTVVRKGDILRTSILFEPGATALREYMFESSNPDRLLFPAFGTGQIPRTTYNTVWCEVRAKVGLPELRFHDLRHFHATWLLDQGASDMDVAIQLGQRDGGTQVRRTYGHPSRARALARLRELTRSAA